MTTDVRILLDFDGDRRDIAEYERHGGYRQLKKALAGEPADIVAAVDASGLRGRGGAGFPTGRKASFLPKDRKPAYLCVNADESEPGTFKDREIMLRNPHALIEGVLTMSYGIGATSAFIYIRGEYRTEFEVLKLALEQAREHGYVGSNVLDSGYDATVVLHRGAGAYICGEETALLSSLEGERGQPRSKPPFPAVACLYASPTLVNNVETIATVPFIIEKGGEW
jgi:NADH-quinone oxidoreductase subunit F